jgi:flagellar basal body rod protein FlgC
VAEPFNFVQYLIEQSHNAAAAGNELYNKKTRRSYLTPSENIANLRSVKSDPLNSSLKVPSTILRKKMVYPKRKNHQPSKVQKVQKAQKEVTFFPDASSKFEDQHVVDMRIRGHKFKFFE